MSIGALDLLVIAAPLVLLAVDRMGTRILAHDAWSNWMLKAKLLYYDGGTFHRTVKMDNQPESTVKIEVIQAGVNPDKAKSGFPAIPLERTNKTGLLHKDGAVSMARGMPDSATSGWFICVNDQPSLDFGGTRNPDGQGFAAFGRVVSGMDVVRKIQQAPSSTDRKTNTEAQKLTPPILLLHGARDYQVTARDHAALASALGAMPNVTAREFPGLNHLFMAGEGPGRPEEYAQAGHVDQAVVAAVAA